MESERNNNVRIPSLTKEARAFNGMATDNTIQGMKMAMMLDRLVREAERKKGEETRPMVEEKEIPTGSEIRKALEEGEYR